MEAVGKEERDILPQRGASAKVAVGDGWPGSMGVSPNTVSLDNHNGGLSHSGRRLGSTPAHWKFWPWLLLDASLPAQAPAAPGFGFSEVFAHQREHPGPFLRGKLTGPGLFAWI